MIIVKTKNGDHFINEKSVIEVQHDREKAVVNCYGANGYFSHHEDVEGVIYTNDAQPTSWQDEGSALEKARKDNDQKSNIIKRLRQEKQTVMDDLHHFASDMEQLVYTYQVGLPDEVRRQIQEPALKLKLKVLNRGYDSDR